MIIGIDLPQGARIEHSEDGNKVLIVFDEENTRMDLWKARLGVFLTEGQSESDFFGSKTLDHCTIEIGHRNKFRIIN